ncbi:MAG: ABC transporter substrate-binding protein [candidate division WOR-3 bacterium]|nr:ABC transporter substrate-binding protein [candidate division WOR-3 bacterium]MCX7837163.1 ABC transporter substrate-binding protein [candidate division WOR-3 bacterium]MDW8114186.1 ABC transporter substrate-binding protein [candidate division WOR-3 bacterium]
MKVILNILIVVLLAGLLYVLIYPQYEESKIQQVKIACDSSVASVIYLVAKDTGFFKSERIEPVFVFYQNPNEGIEKLIKNECDMGIFPWLTVFNYMKNKNETLMVFTSYEFQSGITVDAIIINQQKLKIKDKITFGVLKNKKFGLPFGYLEISKEILTKMGVDIKTVNFIEGSFGEIYDKFLKGEIDAGLFIEPYRSLLINQGYYSLFEGALPKIYMPAYPGYAVGFYRDFFNKKRRVCARIKKITDAAIAIVDKDAKYAREVYKKYFTFVTTDVRLPDVQKTSAMNKGAIISLFRKIYNEEPDTTILFAKPYQLQL